MVQIEHRQGVENLEEILAVPGVDCFIVGPYDLSASYGVAGQFDHPKVTEALATIRASGYRAKIPSGFHDVEPDPAELLDKASEGYRFLAYSVDQLFLVRSAASGLAAIRKELSS